MRFGSAFKEGMRRFLSGECDPWRRRSSAVVEEKDFGGPALSEYWKRQARALASCEDVGRETAREASSRPAVRGPSRSTATGPR